MNKKIISIIMIIFLMFIFTVPVFAAPPGANTMRNISNPTGISKLTTAGNRVVGIVYAFGTIAAVGILMTIGIKYMMSSPDDRASLKTRAIPYLIGAGLTFAAVNVVAIISEFAKKVE